MSLSSAVATRSTRRASSKRSSHPSADAPPDPAPSVSPPALLETSATLADSLNEEAADVCASVKERVRFARTFGKLSKAELARRVGVCLSAAVQWELPKGTSPNVSNLIRIATISGVGFEWLATGRGSPKLADGAEIAAKPEDLEFELQLIIAARALPDERRALLIDLARSMAEP